VRSKLKNFITNNTVRLAGWLCRGIAWLPARREVTCS